MIVCATVVAAFVAAGKAHAAGTALPVPSTPAPAPATMNVTTPAVPTAPVQASTPPAVPAPNVVPPVSHSTPAPQASQPAAPAAPAQPVRSTTSTVTRTTDSTVPPAATSPVQRNAAGPTTSVKSTVGGAVAKVTPVVHAAGSTAGSVVSGAGSAVRAQTRAVRSVGTSVGTVATGALGRATSVAAVQLVAGLGAAIGSRVATRPQLALTRIAPTAKPNTAARQSSVRGSTFFGWIPASVGAPPSGSSVAGAVGQHGFVGTALTIQTGSSSAFVWSNGLVSAAAAVAALVATVPRAWSSGVEPASREVGSTSAPKPNPAPLAPLPGRDVFGASPSATGGLLLVLLGILTAISFPTAPRMGRRLRSTPVLARLETHLAIENPG